MADRPIIFSAPMIRALLDGRKTQTRRVLKPQPVVDRVPSEIMEDHELRGWLDVPCGDQFATVKRLPYAPGDRLWVREAHYLTDNGDNESVVYAADVDDADAHKAAILSMQADLGLTDKWAAPHLKRRSPIHMPRWASRLTLTVTDVWVQRLQDTSEDDAMAEGIEPYNGPADVPEGEPAYRDYYKNAAPGWWLHSRGSFASLWNSIHGPDAWDANPWVAAITFTVERGNIDEATNA